MKETIETLEDSPVRERVEAKAGGAPVTKDFVEKFGGDAYTPNAAASAEKTKSLAGSRHVDN